MITPNKISVFEPQSTHIDSSIHKDTKLLYEQANNELDKVEIDLA